jgi:hypothetical protein
MYDEGVRTTIELRPKHRARLRELAARRGQKGLLSVIQQAVDAYLEAGAGTERSRGRSLALRGVLPAGQAEQLRRETEALRGFWR